MIRVAPQPEPAAFDANVRIPGRAALTKGLDPLPPYWRDQMLVALHTAYGGICAYLCTYIPRGTGARSTDHYVAKSRDRSLAYEWLNYRLACSLMNSRKAAFDDILDPFEIEDGWFVLELSGLQVLPNPDLSADLRRKVQATIDQLDLNDTECLAARAEWYDDYLDHRRLDVLKRRSPFVASELQRQAWV